jgi:hypothetical protein
MQRSGIVLLAHDADLRAADVDPRTGFDAICDYVSFPVRIEIIDAFHTPAGGSATPADRRYGVARGSGGRGMDQSVGPVPDRGARRAALEFSVNASSTLNYFPSTEAWVDDLRLALTPLRIWMRLVRISEFHAKAYPKGIGPENRSYRYQSTTGTLGIESNSPSIALRGSAGAGTTRSC